MYFMYKDYFRGVLNPAYVVHALDRMYRRPKCFKNLGKAYEDFLEDLHAEYAEYMSRSS